MMDRCRLCGGSFIAAVGKAASPQGSVSACVCVDLERSARETCMQRSEPDRASFSFSVGYQAESDNCHYAGLEGRQTQSPDITSAWGFLSLLLTPSWKTPPSRPRGFICF